MRTILKISKYIFILTLFVVIALFFTFIYYSRQLDYVIPKSLHVEIYDGNGDLYLTLNNENRKNYAKIKNIDQDIINAFISIEDKKFYKHNGVDLVRIGGALLSNIENNSLQQGASTITQQYARTLFLTSSKNYRRKLQEAMIAINLESKYTKDEILEGYLNSIYFDHGIYGIDDAAWFYFNKSSADVSLAEAAALASIPKGPIYYSPINNPENNYTRRCLVLEEMYEDGKITKDDLDEAKETELEFYGNLDRTDDNNAPYYQDIIINELKDLKITDKYSNIKVYTSLDLKLNHIVLDSVNKYFPNDNDLQIAIFAMDPKTGRVLTTIGGKDYNISEYNRATTALRQPGSAIKPFLYYAAIDYGFTPATTFESTKTDFYVNGNVYSPTNFGDIYPNREVSMAYALAVSDNIYAIKTHLFLGTDVLVHTLKSFGFTSPINDNVSLALGTSEVRLSELVAGYSKLASLGTDVKPRYIMQITDADDKVIYKTKDDFNQVFGKDDCYILAETMTNVFDNRLAINISTTGAAIANRLTKKYAGKSGSTNTDNWMIGYNSDIVLGIWTGYDDNKFIDNNATKYIKYIWADVVERYMEDRGNGWYETPKNVVPIALNPISGQVAHAKEYKKNLYFKADNLPWYIFDN